MYGDSINGEYEKNIGNSKCCEVSIVQTNEEWLDTLSTVDKAIWLSKVAEKLKGNVWMWENWLKEAHRGSE